jgi:signal transduction histidine kinase
MPSASAKVSLRGPTPSSDSMKHGGTLPAAGRCVLYEFIAANREEIIARTRRKVAARPSPRATQEELHHGVPLFLTQLVETLRLSEDDGAAIGESASKHGGEQLRRGFTVGQVVHGYGDVCQSVTELAQEKDARITAEDFHTFNRCLDDAIARAVTEYTRQRELRINEASTERLGSLAHELRNRLSGALLAYEILKRGNVGVNGSTGAVLGRSLIGIRDLIDRSFAEVRLELGVQKRERISLSELVGEVDAEAAVGVNAGGVTMSVDPVEDMVFLDADRQILHAALANLVQNAFKYTRAGSLISIHTRATVDRVFIDVEDQCGGLPPGKPQELFERFEQRGPDRTGLGLGLTISRRGVEANGGNVSVRDLPGRGCVFTIELPRAPHS